MQKLISQGAEAKIYLEEKSSSHNNFCERSEQQFIIKDRTPKAYRISELDEKIRKSRTKSETKLLLKASKLINTPIPEETKEKYKIIMPFIKGEKLSENLDNFELKKQISICKSIGESISKIHKEGIIHGDLTTSNMIYVEKNSELLKNIQELKKLNLPKKEFAIFGSAPMGIRNLRECNDLDIIVKESLWKNLLKKYPVEKEKLIKIGSIEIYKNWMPWFNDVNSLIDNAETINKLRFVKLENVLSWKKSFGREKDLKDVKLIEDYLKNKSLSHLESETKNPKVYFIDFGLGYQNGKHEDKAVDLHVLKQALEAKHFSNWEKLWEAIKKGYESKDKEQSKKVLEQLKKVELRGRYKH